MFDKTNHVSFMEEIYNDKPDKKMISKLQFSHFYEIYIFTREFFIA